jgi:hypothetical protein
VLVCIAANPDMRLRDIAEHVGITERAVFGIVHDLEEAGYVERVREGRRNHYVVDPGRRLRHPLEERHVVGDLLGALGNGVPPQADPRCAPGNGTTGDQRRP